MNASRFLNYSSHNPRRKRVVRLVLAAAIVALAVAVVTHYGPGWWSDARFAYWQYRCRTFQPPRGTLMYAQGKAASTFRGPLPSHCERKGDELVTIPTCWEKYFNVNLHSIGGGFPPDDELSPNTVYLHERHPKEGGAKILYVAVREARGSELQLEFVYLDIVGFGKPLPLCGRANLYIDMDDDVGPDLRLSAGDTDLQDPSHFTILYSTSSKSGVIDCWLTEGIDSVTGIRIDELKCRRRP